MSQNIPTLRKNLDLLGTFLSQERSIIFPVFTYAIAVGLFSLIIPLTVQELVNTFAFSVSPLMVLPLWVSWLAYCFLSEYLKYYSFTPQI